MKNSSAKPLSCKRALVIGGGAPNSSLMAGALVAFIEQQVTFDVISTSGAGALMGLLYAAPRGGDPVQALERWSDMGVSDPIYQMFGMNYKVFMKPGLQADWYRQMLAANPLTRPYVNEFADNAINGLFGDWVRLILATLSPSDLSSKSLGLCAHLPFAEQAIDFAAVPELEPEFYINAYNVTRSEMTIWDKRQITPIHFRAAFSFPFIYPPSTIDGEDYIEGAVIDALNFKALVSDDETQPGRHPEIDTLVVFDILGADKMIRLPHNLYDAWVCSIITPLVEIAKDDLAIFELKYNVDRSTGLPKRRLLKVDLMGGIPVDHWPRVLDWSNSNLRLLFNVGYNAGQAFCREHAEALGLDFDARYKYRPLEKAA